MAVETLKTVTARLVLEDGYDSQGNMKYTNQTVQYISKIGYDGDKLLAVVGAITPVLSLDLSTTDVIKTLVVSAS